MCDRYSLRVNVEAIVHTTHETRIEVIHEPCSNIAPGQKAPVLLRQPDGVSAAMFRWGLIPSWTTYHRSDSFWVNAPAESITTDGLLRAALDRRRCAVPTDGFYLWMQRGPDKVRWRFCRADGRIFLMAGLWESWGDSSGGDPLQTFTIVTTATGYKDAPVPESMPAILAGDAAPIWLDPKSTRRDRLAALRPPPPNFLTAYPVSSAVNDAGNTGQGSWAPVPPEAVPVGRDARALCNAHGSPD